MKFTQCPRLYTSLHLLQDQKCLIYPMQTRIAYVKSNIAFVSCVHARFLMFKFMFNCRISALQYCVGFCHTSTCISHKYTNNSNSSQEIYVPLQFFAFINSPRL